MDPLFTDATTNSLSVVFSVVAAFGWLIAAVTVLRTNILLRYAAVLASAGCAIIAGHGHPMTSRASHCRWGPGARVGLVSQLIAGMPRASNASRMRPLRSQAISHV